MGRLIGISLLFILLTTNVEASQWRDLNTSVNEKGLDGPIHVVVGAVGGGLIYHYTEGRPTWQRVALSLFLVSGVALVKETTDKNFDIHDVAEYTFGAGIGCLFVGSF